MNTTNRYMTMIAVTLLAVAGASPVFAQRGGGGFGPPNGGGGFGGPGGPGGGMGRRQPMPASAATLPLEVMREYLALTETQTAQIKTITQTLRATNRPPRPEPGRPSSAGANDERPAPPTREEREARQKAMQAAMQKASTEIINLLTDTQKPCLATLVKGFDVLQAVRIPPFVAQDLKLSDDQWSKIAALGTNARRDSVTALLTDAQITALESARPPRGGGGPGGGGFGGGDGGFGAPPPPPYK